MFLENGPMWLITIGRQGYIFTYSAPGELDGRELLIDVGSEYLRPAKQFLEQHSPQAAYLVRAASANEAIKLVLNMDQEGTKVQMSQTSVERFYDWLSFFKGYSPERITTLLAVGWQPSTPVDTAEARRLRVEWQDWCNSGIRVDKEP